MEKEKYVILLAILAVICAASLSVIRNQAEGQDGSEVETRFDKNAKEADRILSTIVAGKPRSVWNAGVRIQNLGEGVIPHLKKSFLKFTPEAQVAAAFALAQLGQRTLALEKTKALLSQTHPPAVACLAADLCGKIGDSSCEKTLLEGLDKALDPSLKIALSKALWDTSRNLRAKEELRSLLHSDEDGIRIPAAFALAEIGDIKAVKRILMRLRDEPTARGRLARELLRQNALYNRIERAAEEGGERKKRFDDPILDEIHMYVKSNYVDEIKGNFERLAAESARGIARMLDPFSAYLSEKEMERLQERLTGKLQGIGVKIGRPTYFPKVGPVRYGSPADVAGIRPLDEIIEINGRKIAEDGLTVAEVENLLHGLSGKKLELKTIRRGWVKTRWFQNRDITVACEDRAWPALLTEVLPGGVLYVKVSEIRNGLRADLAEAVRKAGDVKGMLLDLRSNGGGPEGDAVDFLDFFLDKDTPLFSTEGRDKELAPRREYKAVRPRETSLPLVVLTDGGTFRMAEVVAGVLKARDRARLVGQKTFGAGSFQQMIMLKATGGKTGLRLTVGRYYIGKSSFDKLGVEPHVVVEIPEKVIWKPELEDEFLKENRAKAYLDPHFTSDPAVLRRLARFDGRDPGLYPGFDAWHKGLETHLDPEDTRRLLRAGLRRRIEVLDGRPMPVDLVDDPILLRGLGVLAGLIGFDPSTVAEYRFVPKK